ncbi:host cell division inhibitor Icd-like protein [Providencia rettgeri]|uniref:Host cell division inhibitor Icd-like protein n=1 Tax=Providencia rettgeri TaxID=587 RepID=A0AAE3CXW2_PRORE|nr:host cell division inhibitor Icd-like protein [Providencia rettgeri]EHZ7765796.1 ash family protein [Providencia rettgeri]EIJ7168938.1 ash family protein [Providencia rettgeri]EJD6046874.1 ash family protein [Providencia rettgeri]ELR5106411.1 ash family protein [Providencia rettgeri]MBQ0604977.1 ash family protein [Providencia rettgeri]
MKIKKLHLSKGLGYSSYALAKSNVRIGTLKYFEATVDAQCVFFYVVNNAYLMANCAYSNSMVALLGQPFGWLVSLKSSSSNPLNVTTPLEIGTSGGDSLKNFKEIIVMMAIPTQTQFKFLFLCVKRSDITAKPCRLSAIAPTEQSARSLLVRDFILLFAGRLPVQSIKGE